MDKVLDRIGIYDFFGVIFPGIIAASVGFYYYPQSYDFLYNFTKTDSMRYFFFFVYSYILGQILHEVGFYYEKKWMFRKGEPQDVFLLNENKILSSKEKELYQEKFTGNIVLNVENFDCSTCRVIYNYCKEQIKMKKIANSFEKIESLYGMTRCLYTLFFINSILNLVVYGRMEPTIRFWIHEFISIIVWLLFYYRAKRYAQQRVKVVMRTYLTLD